MIWIGIAVLAGTKGYPFFIDNLFCENEPLKYFIVEYW